MTRTARKLTRLTDEQKAAMPAFAEQWIERGYLGVAPGSYELRRQREQADELRLVAD